MIQRTALALAASLTLTLAPAFSQDDTKTFSKAVVDIGMVVKDIEVSARFYTEVLGLKEVKGFSVSAEDRKSTRLNSSHVVISYAVSCLKEKKQNKIKEKIR